MTTAVSFHKLEAVFAAAARLNSVPQEDLAKIRQLPFEECAEHAPRILELNKLAARAAGLVELAVRDNLIAADAGNEIVKNPDVRARLAAIEGYFPDLCITPGLEVASLPAAPSSSQDPSEGSAVIMSSGHKIYLY